MVHLSDLAPGTRDRVLGLECATFETAPFVEGPPLSNRKVAMVSTAGLLRRGETPFKGGDHHYHAIPHDIDGNDLLMSHASVNFDRTGFYQDINVAFPRDRLNELKAEGVIADVAHTHYSFMGATDPVTMEADARELAERLHNDGVDSVVLLPV